jgi:hypothetical protein
MADTTTHRNLIIMRFSIPSRVRTGWASAGLALLAVACDRSEQVAGPRAVPSPTLALQVSSRSAASGERVAIAISNPSRVSVGGVQGTLTFDATHLRYRGQVRDGSDDVLMVNAARADAGELRLAVLDADGLTRSGSLVFDVIRGGEYASSIGFSVEETMLNGSPVARVSANVARDLEINSALSTDANAKRITPTEWAELTKTKGASFSRDPGEIRNPLRYGDTNFDGVLTLADAVYLINISLGLNEMIVGSDGTGPLGDRDAVVAGNVFPFGPPVGIEANGDRVISLGDAVAVINESIAIDQPAVGDIIPGRPATPVTNRVIVNANVTTNTTWTSDNIYELQGGIFVTGGATLTIQPGTRVEGQRGTGPGVNGSALFVSRDGKLIADGTPLQPIVFTCVGEPKAKGCWGGLSINGNAGINDGTLTSPVIPGRAATGGCREKAAEGGAGLYGGCNDDDNSGILRYVRVEYAGFRFTPENELNGIQFVGVGRGTIIDFVQVHAGLDDGIEMFGGTANLKHLVLTANEDDSFDYTEGYRGKVQFVIIQHDPLDSDKGTEEDNFEFNHDATPRAEPVFFNWTIIGKPDPASTAGVPNNNSIAAYNIRRGARPHFFNQYVQNWRAVMDIDDDATCVGSQTATGFEFKNSIVAQNLAIADPDAGDPLGCGGGDEAAFVTGQPTNQVMATSSLLSPLNFVVPDWRPAFGTATGGATPPTDGFFDATATYIGAVPPSNAAKSNIPWYSGWTRGWQSPTTP